MAWTFIDTDLLIFSDAIETHLLISSVAIELPAVNRRQRQPQNPQQQAGEDGQFVVNLFHVY